MPIRFSLLALIAFASPAFAQEAARVVELKTCKIPAGEMRLEAATQIVCDGELKMDDGATITRNGFPLLIYTAKFNGGKAHIVCFDNESPTRDGKCKEMKISAYTLAGAPVINTKGLNEGDLGGDVTIEYASKDSFQPTYEFGRAAGLIDLTVAFK